MIIESINNLSECKHGNTVKDTGYFLICLLILIFFAGAVSCVKGPDTCIAEYSPSRIISLSPAITDIIAGLGFEDNLVGITQYCEVSNCTGKTLVGTLMDINIEQVYLLRPDIIFLSPYHSDLFSKFNELSIQYRVVSLESIDEIKLAIKEIGHLLEAEENALNLIHKVNERILYYRQKSSAYPERSVILVVGRDQGRISSFYAVGRGSFLNEIIENLNCRNPLSVYLPSYPLITHDELHDINPDIIIELYADSILSEKEMEKRLSDWNYLSGLQAVQKGRVYLINKTYIVRPSIKIIDIFNEIYNTINTE